MNQYTHNLTDRTALALAEFSKGLLKISTLRPGKTCSVIMSYDDAPAGALNTEALAYVELDEDGLYSFNTVEIGDLEQVIPIYSMMCAEVIKSIAVDEKREDYFEDLGRSSIETPETNEDRQVRELLASVDLVHEPDESEPDDDGEIIEEYKFE